MSSDSPGQNFESQNFGQENPGMPEKRRVRVASIGLLVIPLLVVLFVAGLLGFIFGTMRSTEPYQHAMQVVKNDARVAALLGAPVKPGWFVSGNIKVSGTSGSAHLSIPLRGSTHNGTLYVVARKSAGLWNYRTLLLIVDGENTSVNLLASSNAGAPRTQQPFMPPSQQAHGQNRSDFILIVAVLALVAITIALSVGLGFQLLKRSAPYRHAVEVVTNDARVQAMLGPPVTPGWRVSGSLRLSGARGVANFSFPVQGSAQKGTVSVAATKSNGAWEYLRLELSIAELNDKINLLA